MSRISKIFETTTNESMDTEVRYKALKWWRETLSINQQNALCAKHFPAWRTSSVVANTRNIIEMYEKEHQSPVKSAGPFVDNEARKTEEYDELISRVLHYSEQDLEDPLPVEVEQALEDEGLTDIKWESSDTPYYFAGIGEELKSVTAAILKFKVNSIPGCALCYKLDNAILVQGGTETECRSYLAELKKRIAKIDQAKQSLYDLLIK